MDDSDYGGGRGMSWKLGKRRKWMVRGAASEVSGERSPNRGLFDSGERCSVDKLGLPLLFIGMDESRDSGE